MNTNSGRFTGKFRPCFDESSGFIYEQGKARADSRNSIDKGTVKHAEISIGWAWEY